MISTTNFNTAMAQKYPFADSMVSGSKGLIFSVTRVSPRSILVELYDPLKDAHQGEPDFVDRCIKEASCLIGDAITEFATSN